MDIRRLVRKNVSALHAYEAKEIPCKVKLDANESPYGFGSALHSVLKIKTNRYPDPEAKALRKVLGKTLGTPPEHILLGNGSDELISYLITTFGGPVLFPVPTFSMYGIIARALGEQPVGIPLDKDFDLDADAMLRAVKRERPKLVFLSSPNNPTGNCFSADRILRIVEASPGLVVVDEAYQAFSGEKGFLPLLKDFGNLVVMRTLSKVGLAALRLGFIIADNAVIAEVNKVRLPFNVNTLSQAVAVEALKEKKALRTAVKAVVAERARLLREMGKIAGVLTYPSEANFILFRVRNPDDIYQALLRKGVLVRNLDDAVKGCLRVTVGSPEENDVFLKALAETME